MSEPLEAFKKPLKQDAVRILINIKQIKTSLTNKAPDFLTPEEDQPKLIISIRNEDNLDAIHLDEVFLDKFNGGSSDTDVLTFTVKDQSVWFDIAMDEVSAVWSADFDFSIKSNFPDYLDYSIQQLDHSLEWLQTDAKTNKITSVSVTNKYFKPKVVEQELIYTIEDIERCADMLGRSIKKIDLRIGSAFVRFNTDNGRLEPAINSIASKLGYELQSVDEKMARNLEKKGNRATHIISLLRNY